MKYKRTSVKTGKKLGQRFCGWPIMEIKLSIDEADATKTTAAKTNNGISKGVLVNTALFSRTIRAAQIKRPKTVIIRRAVNLLNSKNSAVVGKKKRGAQTAASATKRKTIFSESFKKFSFTYSI